ncbi:MAG: hypothetical protein U5Q44_09425 [Dehalococcoidia bacterium]|nr:hypothetical protein [Dehalococcoidia bacterium]
MASSSGMSPGLLLDALPGVAYAIDLNGRLSFIARDAWQGFARSNSAPAMADVDNLIDTPLAQYMDPVLRTR